MTEQAKTEKAAKQPKVLTPEQQRAAELTAKYPALTATFLRGTFKGQLDSVYKDRAVKEEKAADFIKACQAGDLPLPEMFTSVQAKKLEELGLTVRAEMIQPSAARGRGKAEDTADADSEQQHDPADSDTPEDEHGETEE